MSFSDWYTQTMLHLFKDLLIIVGLLLLMTGCGQKGPLFLPVEQPPERVNTEEHTPNTVTTNKQTLDEMTQQSD